jgi:hypothetical protein
VDFFARRAGDDRHWRAFDARPLRLPVRRHRHACRHRLEYVYIFRIVGVRLS